MYIYLIKNKINGKRYVGQSQKSINESTEYYGSGKIICKAINKYGKDNFTKIILQECNDFDELNASEIYWIEELNCKVPNGYNLTDGGGGVKGLIFSDKRRKQTSDILRELWKNDEYRNKVLESRRIFWETHPEVKLERSKRASGLNNGMYNKHHSDNAKKTIGKKNNGKVRTKEFKNYLKEINMGEGNPFYGKTHSDDTREIQKESAIKRFEDPNERKKISDGLKLYYETHESPVKNTKHSEESKKLSSDSAIKRWESVEFRKKYSDVRKGLKFVNKDGIIKLIKPHDMELYLNDGWKIGMKEK